MALFLSRYVVMIALSGWLLFLTYKREWKSLQRESDDLSVSVDECQSLCEMRGCHLGVMGNGKQWL